MNQIDIENPDHVTIIYKENSIHFSVKKTEDGVLSEHGFTFPRPMFLDEKVPLKSKILTKKIKRYKK
tara:strand:+ start:78 stop:278 length:201 start_codon:yes stop_codon:yes gene_type:complete